MLLFQACFVRSKEPPGGRMVFRNVPLNSSLPNLGLFEISWIFWIGVSEKDYRDERRIEDRKRHERMAPLMNGIRTLPTYLPRFMAIAGRGGAIHNTVSTWRNLALIFQADSLPVHLPVPMIVRGENIPRCMEWGKPCHARQIDPDTVVEGRRSLRRSLHGCANSV